MIKTKYLTKKEKELIVFKIKLVNAAKIHWFLNIFSFLMATLFSVLLAIGPHVFNFDHTHWLFFKILCQVMIGIFGTLSGGLFVGTVFGWLPIIRKTDEEKLADLEAKKTRIQSKLNKKTEVLIAKTHQETVQTPAGEINYER